jgi:hypothetical protein
VSHEETPTSVWENLFLGGDPQIILGRREKGGIAGVRIDVHEDFHAELRYVCELAVIKISETSERPYEPNAALESGEQHFSLSSDQIGDLLGRTAIASDEGLESSEAEGAAIEPALISCLAEPTVHRLATRDEFNNFGPFFYAVCWQQPDRTWAAFVRKTNPQQFFKAGRVWCQYATTLKRLDTQPTFALDPQIDLIVYEGRIISFSASALNFLFTDIRLAQSGVPAQVAKISDLIMPTIPLSERSTQSLVAAGARLKTVANRIYGLSARLSELQEMDTLTLERYREIASDDEEALKLIDADGHLDFDEAGAHVFLDVIEGRYFEDDWTGSPRRADRFSSRNR